MTKLTAYEFNLLQGTDLVVNLIRNKVKLNIEHVNWLDDFMGINSRGLYYTVPYGDDYYIVYCEHAADAENIRRIAERDDS